jgi:HKD family nuclease
MKIMILLISLHSLYSYRKRHIEQLLNLTDTFTWEELPIRDPDTRHLTKAGYIPVIQRLNKYAFIFAMSYKLTQSAYLMVTEYGMVLTSWFPFDLSVTTVYVIANTMQVGSTA